MCLKGPPAPQHHHHHYTQSIIMATALLLLFFFCTPLLVLIPNPPLLAAAANEVARRILPAWATTKRGMSSTSILFACSALSNSITCFLDSLSLILMPCVCAVCVVNVMVNTCEGLANTTPYTHPNDGVFAQSDGFPLSWLGLCHVFGTSLCSCLF